MPTQNFSELLYNSILHGGSQPLLQALFNRYRSPPMPLDSPLNRILPSIHSSAHWFNVTKQYKVALTKLFCTYHFGS